MSFLLYSKNFSQVKQLKFAIPKTLKEQTAIANALSDVDALTSELEKLIAKKQAIKTATMQQLLTGKTRLPQFALREDGTPKGYKASELGEIPEDWKVVKFLDATNLITCGIAATPTYVKENVGVPFLSSTNVKAGRIIWENHKYISYDLHNQLYRNNPPLKGDVLYSRVGTIGEAAVIEEDFEFSIYVSLTLIKPKSSMLNSYFLSHLLNSKPYKQRASDQVYLGGGVGNLNVDIVRNYPISIPKLEEQVSISSILSDMDEEIQTLQQRLNKTRQIKQGMMQELLTGKTRLI
jgi:type I restriction enzyme S subunit